MMKYEIYTDGSCLGNPGPGGYGLVISYRDSEGLRIQLTERSRSSDTTNNREELKAIISAFEHMEELLQPEDTFTIYSDSAYCVNMCNDWIRTWASKGWKRSKNQPIENLDLVQTIYNYLNKFSFQCQIQKVKGHANDVGNELADALATNNLTRAQVLLVENFVDKNLIL